MITAETSKYFVTTIWIFEILTNSVEHFRNGIHQATMQNSLTKIGLVFENGVLLIDAHLVEINKSVGLWLQRLAFDTAENGPFKVCQTEFIPSW